MTMLSTAQRSWTRVFVERPDELALALDAAGIHEGEAARFPLRFVSPDPRGARVTEVEILLAREQIVTIEPAGGLPLLQDVEARLLWEDAAECSAPAVGIELVRAGYRACAESLGLIESDIRRVRASVAVLTERSGSSRGISVSDLPEVSELLTDIDAVLSHVSYAVGRLTQFARMLRRAAAEGGSIPRSELDALIQQGDALAGRVEFLVDRHRFHAQGTAQQIATSDLNIVKIFTVLWAILIPGSTLINWYGQNFEFMPELSWTYSSWIQILGVFCLAVLPIYTVKRAGQLR